MRRRWRRINAIVFDRMARRLRRSSHAVASSVVCGLRDVPASHDGRDAGGAEVRIWITKDAETEGIRCVEAEQSSAPGCEALFFHHPVGRHFPDAYEVGRTCELTEGRAREAVRERVLDRHLELTRERRKVEAWLEDPENPKVVEEP